MDNNENLFRKEAINAFSQRKYGKPIAFIPNLWIIFTLLLLFIFTITAWYLSSISYSRKETVSGWLVPDMGVLKITTPEGGYIDSVYVNEGDLANKGKVLAKVAIAAPNTNVAISSMSSSQDRKKRQRDLNRQIEIERKVAINRAEAIEIAIDAKEKEQELIRDQIERQEIIVKLLTKDTSVPVETNSVDKTDLNMMKELHQHRVRLFSLNEKKINVALTLASLKNQIDGLNLESEIKLSRITNEIIRFTSQKDELNQRLINIVSPVDGRVSNLHFRTGDSVRSFSTLASLIPSDSKIQAEMYITSRAVAFVEQDMKVRLMVDAFPHRKYGVVTGTIKSISNSSLTPNEVPLPSNTTEGRYKVIATLDSDKLRAFNKEFSFKPGMTFRAEIILESRTLFQLIFEPIVYG